MIILTCNVGSTSLKFKLFDMPEGVLLSEGKAERVGSEDDAIYTYINRRTAFKIYEKGQCISDYTTGIKRYLSDLTSDHGVLGSISDVAGVVFKCPFAPFAFFKACFPAFQWPAPLRPASIRAFRSSESSGESRMNGMKNTAFIAAAITAPLTIIFQTKSPPLRVGRIG